MSSHSPIFILSCERSGSTLLRYILDTHPEITCPGELYLGKLIADLKLTLSRTTALVKTRTPEELEKETYLEMKRILTGVLSEYTRLRGKKIWCEKTPFDLHHLPEIEKTFPDARYICLYRNSLDVVHSCLERRQKLIFKDWTKPYEARHPYNFAAAMLESWSVKTEKMIHFEAEHPRTFRIRYEDLVLEPVKKLDLLFEFLNLRWEASLLDQVFSSPHDPGGGDEKIGMTHKIEKKNIGKGSQIDPKLLALIPVDLQQQQKKLHRELGY
jgi:hypothetical protein